jgi:hypothetical protein
MSGNGIYHTNWDQQRERLSAYLDGELPASAREPLERHLAGCAECRRELDALREVRALLRALPLPALTRSFTIPAGGAVPEPIVPRRAARSGRAGGLIARAAQWTGGIAAAAGLVLVLGSALSGFSGFHAGGASTMSAAGPARPSSTMHAPSGTRGPQIGATSGTATQSSATATPSPTATASAAAAQGGSDHANSLPLPSAPPLALTGAGLIAGGAVLLVAGKAAERRRRRSASASRAR